MEGNVAESYAGKEPAVPYWLEWRDVDLPGRELCLGPEVSRNKDAGPLPLRGELLEIVQREHQKRSPDCPYVFHDDGKPIGDFRKAWQTACNKAGLTGIIVHDLRGTDVRNMVRAGMPERVATELSGRKTRRILDRYNILSSEDLAAATERLQGHLMRQSAKTKTSPLVPAE